MKFWSTKPAATAVPNTVTPARSPGAREFDEILSADRNGSAANMSDEEFLPADGSPGSSPQRRLKEPIPANRAALIRQIEDENRRLRERQRFRELGYQALLVITVVVSLALLTIALWLFYVAWRGAGGMTLTKEDLRRLAREAAVQARRPPAVGGSITRTTRNVNDVWDRVLEGGDDDEQMAGTGTHHQLHRRSHPIHYPKKIVSIPTKLSSTSARHRAGPQPATGEEAKLAILQEMQGKH